MPANHTEVVEDFYARLERAWNAADGAAYGGAFTEDASFVNVRGDAADGQAAIVAGHQGIFDTIYRGSVVHYDVQKVWDLADGMILARGHATLEVPGGPLAGTHNAVNTVVLVQTGDGWAGRAFHNTFVSG